MKEAFAPLASDDGVPVSLKSNPLLSAWVSFSENEGCVCIHSGKVELGQNILTALAQIAARALAVPVARITMMPARTGASPDESITSGSLSIQHSGMSLRMACGHARRLFTQCAAALAGVDPSAVSVHDGAFLAGGRELGTYWSLARYVDLAVPVEPPPGREAAPSEAGWSEPALGLADKMHGRYGFIHDLSLPDMLHGRMLRPPSIGARLVHLDPAAVQGLECPVQVVQSGSLVGVLARHEHVADQAVARLAASAQWREQACLPAQDELPAWLRRQLCDTRVYRQQGPADAAGAAVASTCTGDYFKPFIKHASIGPSCAHACLRGDGTLKVWMHGQGIYNFRADLAAAFGMAAEQIIVEHVPGAGCYGHNGADDAAFDAAWLARHAPGRHVRVQWSRADELCWAPQGPPMSVRLQVDVDARGRILDWRADAWGPGHSLRPGRADTPTLLGSWHHDPPSPRLSAINAPIAAGGGAERNIIPCYDIPCSALSSHRVIDMPVRTSSLRCLGAFANVFAIEAMVDDIARAHGIDPADYRLGMLSDPRAIAVIDAVRDMSGWNGRPAGSADMGWGMGYARYKNKGAYCAVVARVTVAEKVSVRELFIAVDVGEVINPDGVVQQIEGGAIQACSWATLEQARFSDRMLTDDEWEKYPIIRFTDVPDVQVRILPRPDQPPMGAGEPSLGPVAGAIGNAVRDALGVRVSVLPLDFDNIARAIEVAA
ncbi:molybdopterin cofactor-binding domain-containing protein [Bordetella petrii]|uniref:molybdopterin cofactor-binding domain-containing protein n=1 Tax=Bordetella petrii TaxID=94624 RepID=UPI001A97496B|nr:molybdopterin cofactor-binding domain-containing protein [Bordetella petrii]MBO1113209.1 xanthine dehydrogenase family protein molybdopterin-binding subunit [Bordetella petrii]